MAENARGKKDNNSHDASSEAAFGTKATKTDAKSWHWKSNLQNSYESVAEILIKFNEAVSLQGILSCWTQLKRSGQTDWFMIPDGVWKALPKLGDEFPNVSNMNEPAKVSFRDQNVPWQAPASLRCHSGRDPANEMHRANRSNLVLDLASIDWNSGDKHMRSRRVQGHWGWTRPNAQILSPPKKMKLRSIEFVV